MRADHDRSPAGADVFRHPVAECLYTEADLLAFGKIVQGATGDAAMTESRAEYKRKMDLPELLRDFVARKR